MEEKKEKKKFKFSFNINIPFHVIAVICICVFCIGISPKTLQNDTYYAVPIGEYIAQNGISDLTQDPFSWHNLSYVYPHWLYDFFIFLVYNAGGFLGVYISTMVLSSILGIMIYALANKKSKNKWISLAVTIWALYMMRDFIAARAYSITFILFVLEVFSIEKLLETKKKIYGIILFLIPLLLANVHSAVFPFYYILYLPYLAEAMWIFIEEVNFPMLLYGDYVEIKYNITKNEEKKAQLKERIEKIKIAREKEARDREEKRNNPKKLVITYNSTILLLIAIMVASLLMGFINPAGNNAFTYLYKTFKGNTTDCINEHLPMTLMNFKPFALALIAMVMVLVFSDVKVKMPDLFMLAGLIYMSFVSRRQVALFAVICMPILAGYFADFVRSINSYEKLSNSLEKFACTLSGALIVVCCFTLYTTNQLKERKNQPYVNGNDYPVEASTWILDNLDVNKIHLYNEYNYGSYLIFRGIPVFIDSRADLYAPEFNEDKENGIEGRDIFMDVMNIDDFKYDYKEAFENYGVTHVILYSGSKLSYVLEKDSNYKMLYNEGNFKIFERLNKPKESEKVDEVSKTQDS